MSLIKFNDLLKGEARILHTQHAFVLGRLFVADGQPFYMQNVRYPEAVYGVVHEVDITPRGIELIDRLMGCSLSNMGFNYKKDLVNRVKQSVTFIEFDDMSQFSKLNYKVVGEGDAWLYITNDNNKYMYKQRRNREIRCGNVWRDFFATKFNMEQF